MIESSLRHCPLAFVIPLIEGITKSTWLIHVSDKRRQDKKIVKLGGGDKR